MRTEPVNRRRTSDVSPTRPFEERRRLCVSGRAWSGSQSSRPRKRPLPRHEVASRPEGRDTGTDRDGG